MTLENLSRPRIGIPWRTSREEAEQNRPKIQNYEQAVRQAGGEPVLLSLADPQALHQEFQFLNGFVLPGSPADVDPTEYGAVNGGKSEPADLLRERTDHAILDHAFLTNKPILAICYGCQLLNVHLGGTLIQDLHTETATKIAHRKKDATPEPEDDPRHGANFEPGSRLFALAPRQQVQVNSSHHQAIDNPGRRLRVTARAPDGIVEALEWIGDGNWVVGVQWHPERMPGDALAERLFAEFVDAARAVHAVSLGKS